MPLQNRVTPLGEIVADPARGLVYGNRGCLHDVHKRIRRHHNGKRWIACRLRFKDWHRHPLMQPGRFTELFFLDEATAMAAGHRACALCRREDYRHLQSLWRGIHDGRCDADTMDAKLHRERSMPMTARAPAPIDTLPDGTFVLLDERPWLVLGARLLRWTPAGYVEQAVRRANPSAPVITPPSLVEVLRSGWCGAVPLIHPSAESLR